VTRETRNFGNRFQKSAAEARPANGADTRIRASAATIVSRHRVAPSPPVKNPGSAAAVTVLVTPAGLQSAGIDHHLAAVRRVPPRCGVVSRPRHNRDSEKVSGTLSPV
jgi:hypothetical protein